MAAAAIRSRWSRPARALVLLCAVGFVTAACTFRHTAEGQREGVLRAFDRVVQEEVADPVRREQVLALAVEVDAALADYQRAQQHVAEALHTLNADYDATPAQFQAAFDEANARRQSLRAMLVDRRHTMATLMTADEWQRVTNRDATLVTLVRDAPVWAAGQKPE